MSKPKNSIVGLRLHEWGFGYSSGVVGVLKRSALYDRAPKRSVRLFEDVESWRETATEESRRAREVRAA